jgi:polyisoprenyl-teichoic acid--peptidoglycan teichoic acid transferase
VHDEQRPGPLPLEGTQFAPPPRRRRRRLLEGCVWLVCLLAIAGTVAGVHDAMVPEGPRWMRLAPPIPCLFGDPFGGKRVVALLLVGTDQENTLCDTILVALVDRRTKRIGLLSFPRDLYVTPPKGSPMKINAVVGSRVNAKGSLKQGLELLCETMRSEFGIVVDGYARIDVKAFQQVVDAVGGVDVTVPKGPHGKGLHYQDASQKLDIDLNPGPQHLNGTQAMGFVRWRQDNCSAHHGDGDIGRTKRQQDFLKAVTAKVAAKMKASKLSAARTALDMAGIAHRNTTTNLTLGQIRAIASLAREVDRSGIVAKTVPTGASKMIHGQFAFPPDPAGTQKAVKGILAELAGAPSP